MKKLIALLAVLAAFVVPAAQASSQDSGDGAVNAVWIINYVTYDGNGNPWYWNCEYVQFSNGLTIQTRCW